MQQLAQVDGPYFVELVLHSSLLCLAHCYSKPLAFARTYIFGQSISSHRLCISITCILAELGRCRSHNWDSTPCGRTPGLTKPRYDFLWPRDSFWASYVTSCTRLAHRAKPITCPSRFVIKGRKESGGSLKRWIRRRGSTGRLVLRHKSSLWINRARGAF